ncbi:MAG TPA: hypothetical protein VFQ53_37760 [Kofleriaceae bacterium]|nr:hypothetical protein [Kofleriaceae bacterium]
MPKTLAEIAIDAGLVTKAGAAKAGKMAEERGQPLVVVLVRELGVDELQLVAAFGKQTRVPLIDPAGIQIDLDALRAVPRDMCARLRVLPLSLATEGSTKIMRLAMADPTDTAAVAEIEQLTHHEIDVSALPLSAIDELVDKGYQQVSTQVVNRRGGSMFITGREGTVQSTMSADEVSVTAQVPFALLQVPEDLDMRLAALVQVLVSKGVISIEELTEALAKLKSTK